VTYLDDHSEWERWAEANGYDDEFVDDGEEQYKRDMHCWGYAHHPETNTYAFVTWTSNYDWGNSNYTIQKKGLVRKEREVTKIEVTYE
jgi:hypothetical protein